MSDWQLWLIGTVLLLIGEMFLPSGFVLACLAIGALAATVMAILPFGLTAQTLLFAGVTLLSAVAVRPFLLRHFRSRGGDVRTNVAALPGKVGLVSERIDPATGRGRVLVDGEDWRGAALDDEPLEAGTRIMVVQVEGNVLKVEREG